MEEWNIEVTRVLDFETYVIKSECDDIVAHISNNCDSYKNSLLIQSAPEMFSILKEIFESSNEFNKLSEDNRVRIVSLINKLK